MAGPGAPMPRATGKALDAWLRQRARQVRIPLAVAIGLGAIGGLLLVAQAWLLALILNAVIIDHLGLAAVRLWLIALLVIFAARAIVTAATDIAAFEAVAIIKRDLRRKVYAQLEALGPVWARRERTGDIVNTIVDGIEALESYYGSYLPQMALAVFIPLAILVFVFPAYWVGGLIMVITAPLIPVFMIIIGKGTERLNQRQWRKLARMSAHFFDSIEGLTTLKLFNASRAEAAMIAQVSDEYRRDTIAVLRVAFLSSLVLEFFATISVALIAVFIGFNLYYREIAFLPGIFVLLLAPEFYRPLRNMGTQYHARMTAIGASEQIVRLLDAKPRPPSQASSALAAHPELRIVFEEVGFAYEPEAPVLHGIGFGLKRGESIALVGPSGAGKTTIGQLLLGFITPTSGRITIDGTDLRDLDTAGWQARIAWLPQRPTLFHGTVRDNISLGMAAGEAEIRHAATLAHADGFIAALPSGYDTILGDAGQGLSGGEIHRIALARAFLKDADLVVLDEAVTGLDPESASLITSAIAVLARDRAVLIIAHRLETIRQADRIMVLEQGRIVEAGDHDALMARNGAYAAMVRLHEQVRM
ncbi:thiol reductant ABC exporter subunit CydD [Acidiphilium acidophilum]|uniref:Thiol reductant ABC exporter subunit CydD n=1 Tax=Acidiphilium acidophilum TaxID=76588 RepID=A0AAW9DSH0_ACIAO|nr:thiol reductant ABC exporter subunit CydD [Acidiphilium acidophilum]MDX5931665.1 thiol reductant ABC exporter subunit CydD [Acidiphilium acidophilum]GBQ08894.1 ABC-type transport system [Acidiphilium acidophilum DSM 700]